MLTQQQIQAYHDDGYLIVKSFFDAEEIELLRRTAVADRQIERGGVGQRFRRAGEVGCVIASHPGPIAADRVVLLP